MNNLEIYKHVSFRAFILKNSNCNIAYWDKIV